MEGEMGDLSEKDLHPALRACMARAGFREIAGSSASAEFILPFGLQHVDAIGFRWDGDDVDAWAIEAKAGDDRSAIRAAVAQALAYSVIVPRVSIASRAQAEDRQMIEPHLQAVGIGHVRMTAKGQLPRGCPAVPERGRLFQQQLFNDTLRHAALLALLARDVVVGGSDEELRCHSNVWPRSGLVKELPSSHPMWGFAVHTTADVQWMLSRWRERDVVVQVWIEKKDAVRRLLEDPSLGLKSLLDVLPSRDDVEVSVRPTISRRAPFGTKRPRLDEERAGRSTKELARLSNYARLVLEKPFVTPRISVTLPLWKPTFRPTRSEATAAVRAGMHALQGAHDHLTRRAAR